MTSSKIYTSPKFPLDPHGSTIIFRDYLGQKYFQVIPQEKMDLDKNDKSALINFIACLLWCLSCWISCCGSCAGSCRRAGHSDTATC